MPIIKSARKRVKVARSANARNVKSKRSMREAIKLFNSAVTSGNTKKIAEAQIAAVSAVDQATKKNILHKNRAARIKARLSSQAKTSGVKPSKAASKPAPAKTAKAIKSTASKTPAKKAKAPVKKPTTKKTAKK